MVNELPIGMYEVVRQRGDKKYLKGSENRYTEENILQTGQVILKQVDGGQMYMFPQAYRGKDHCDIPSGLVCIPADYEKALLKHVDFSSQLKFFIDKLVNREIDTNEGTTELLAFIESYKATDVYPPSFFDELKETRVEGVVINDDDTSTVRNRKIRQLIEREISKRGWDKMAVPEPDKERGILGGKVQIKHALKKSHNIDPEDVDKAWKGKFRSARITRKDIK